LNFTKDHLLTNNCIIIGLSRLQKESNVSNGASKKWVVVYALKKHRHQLQELCSLDGWYVIVVGSTYLPTNCYKEHVHIITEEAAVLLGELDYPDPSEISVIFRRQYLRCGEAAEFLEFPTSPQKYWVSIRYQEWS
ncbi:hypothetical protein ANCCAN_25726, partial [Ancylostoma caninum]